MAIISTVFIWMVSVAESIILTVLSFFALLLLLWTATMADILADGDGRVLYCKTSDIEIEICERRLQIFALTDKTEQFVLLGALKIQRFLEIDFLQIKAGLTFVHFHFCFVIELDSKCRSLIEHLDVFGRCKREIKPTNWIWH